MSALTSLRPINVPRSYWRSTPSALISRGRVSSGRGVGVLLLLLALMTAGCADEGTTLLVSDTRLVDAPVDTEGASDALVDTAAVDTASVDTVVVDTASVDTASVDTVVVDTSDADTTTSDTNIADSADTVDEDVSPWLAADSYCEVTAAFFCRYYMRCGRFAAPDEAACQVAFAESCERIYEPHYRTLADRGLLQLSAAGTAACEAHLDAVVCEQQVYDLDGPCGTMWVGQAEVGAPCGMGIESFVCNAGGTCVLGMNLCGTCTSAAAVGDACGGGVACVTGAACVNSVCVARALPQEACSDTQPCIGGASCVASVCVGHTIVGLGEVCDGENRCPYQSACVGGVCIATGLLGEACDSTTPCASGVCESNECVAPKVGGAACTSGAECLSWSCASGTCVALPGVCF